MARSAGDRNLWLYDPSLIAAIIFSHLFMVTTIVHVWQSVHYRARFCVPLILGGIWEAVGYAIRAASTQKEDSVGLYATQLTLIILAPAFVAAFDYMLLRRLISTYIPDATTLRVPARWLTRIFVACDILSFLTQSTGAGILAGAKNDMSKSKLGERVLMSGLILQVVAFGFFAALIVRFHVKMIVLGASKNWNGRWQPLLFCLYGSCALVTLRSLYRVAEFSQGFHGYLSSHEVFFYVLEAVPMLPPFILFNVWHPMRMMKTSGGTHDVEGIRLVSLHQRN